MADDDKPNLQQPVNAPLSALSQQPPVAEPTIPPSSTTPSQLLPGHLSPLTISSEAPFSPLSASSPFDVEEQPQAPKPEDSRAPEPNSFPPKLTQNNEATQDKDSPAAAPDDQENEEPWDPRQETDPFDWTDLESRFRVQMDACTKEEEAIGQEWKEWAKVFEAWASVPRTHEETRAHKRLKTRISSAQSRERELQEKQQHYKRVLQAFESALALLGASPS
ncbi:MAG: hypothetical protein Q9214_005673 [Letrouitia sp. 1 TL-2023]